VHLDAEEGSIEAAVRLAIESYGGLNGLHANFAALHLLTDDTDVVDVDRAVFDGTTRVNTGSFFLCTRYALPALVARGGDTVVYTSSGAAYDAQGYRVAYAMSKAGRACADAPCRHALLAARRWRQCYCARAYPTQRVGSLGSRKCRGTRAIGRGSHAGGPHRRP
jgi:NADP-dependent 3-hydroxy acid dehydrogenase YdfG